MSYTFYENIREFELPDFFLNLKKLILFNIGPMETLLQSKINLDPAPPI